MKDMEELFRCKADSWLIYGCMQYPSVQPVEVKLQSYHSPDAEMYCINLVKKIIGEKKTSSDCRQAKDCNHDVRENKLQRIEEHI